jgi:hypothetical protein
VTVQRIDRAIRLNAKALARMWTHNIEVAAGNYWGDSRLQLKGEDVHFCGDLNRNLHV